MSLAKLIGSWNRRNIIRKERLRNLAEKSDNTPKSNPKIYKLIKPPHILLGSVQNVKEVNQYFDKKVYREITKFINEFKLEWRTNENNQTISVMLR